MGRLHVGTASGLFVFDQAGGRTARPFEGQDVTSLASNGDGSWALIDGRELWRRTSSDSRWDRVAEVDGQRANCLCPSASALLIGTAEAHLRKLEPGGPTASATDSGLITVEGFERTDGREDWYTPWGGPPDVRSISRGDDGAVYVNVHVGGIARSRDDGASWEPTIDIHADVHQVLAPEGHPGLVLAACAEGLVASADGGHTWDFETDGLHAGYCRAVAVGDGTVYLSASLSHRGQRAALYRRPVDGGPFEKCSQGLPEWFDDNIDTACVAAAGSVVAFGTADGSLFVSADSGRTWESWAGDLPSVRCVTFG